MLGVGIKLNIKCRKRNTTLLYSATHSKEYYGKKERRKKVIENKGQFDAEIYFIKYPKVVYLKIMRS